MMNVDPVDLTATKPPFDLNSYQIERFDEKVINYLNEKVCDESITEGDLLHYIRTHKNKPIDKKAYDCGVTISRETRDLICNHTTLARILQNCGDWPGLGPAIKERHISWSVTDRVKRNIKILSQVTHWFHPFHDQWPFHPDVVKKIAVFYIGNAIPGLDHFTDEEILRCLKIDELRQKVFERAIQVTVKLSVRYWRWGSGKHRIGKPAIWDMREMIEAQIRQRDKKQQRQLVHHEVRQQIYAATQAYGDQNPSKGLTYQVMQRILDDALEDQPPQTEDKRGVKRRRKG